MKNIITIVIVVLFLFGIYKQVENNHRYSQWATKCLNDGGINSETSQGFASTHHECIKDGKIINHVED